MSTSAGEGVRAVSYRWVILAVSFFSIFIGTVSQFQVAGLAYRLIPALHLTPMEFYMVFSAPMLPPFVFSIFGGGLADRYGVKTIVTVAFVVSVIGSVFRYAAHDFVPLFILSALAGVSSALLVTNIAKLLGAWFPRAQFGTAMGIFFAGSTIGMSVGLATAPLFGRRRAPL